MIKLTSNVSEVSKSLTGKITRVKAEVKDKLLRRVATTVHGLVKERIHDKGLNASEAPLGTYDEKYLKRRQSKAYNRSSDSKIIFSLTKKMEDEFIVIPTPNGYGLGWSDARTSGKQPPSNIQKAEFLEERFGKVYSLAASERAEIKPAADYFLRETLGR